MWRPNEFGVRLLNPEPLWACTEGHFQQPCKIYNWNIKVPWSLATPRLRQQLGRLFAQGRQLEASCLSAAPALSWRSPRGLCWARAQMKLNRVFSAKRSAWLQPSGLRLLLHSSDILPQHAAIKLWDRAFGFFLFLFNLRPSARSAKHHGYCWFRC